MTIDTEKIITELLDAGITMEEIAYRCRVTRRSIERWLVNDCKPTRANKIYLDQWHKRKVLDV